MSGTKFIESLDWLDLWLMRLLAWSAVLMALACWVILFLSTQLVTSKQSHMSPEQQQPQPTQPEQYRDGIEQSSYFDP